MDDDDKIKYESEIATLKDELEKITIESNTKSDEITRLQTYICKNLSSEKVNDTDGIKDFKTLYKETISKLGE